MYCFHHGILLLFLCLLLFFPNNSATTSTSTTTHKFVSVIDSVWIWLITWFAACVFSCTIFLYTFLRLIASKFMESLIISTILLSTFLAFSSRSSCFCFFLTYTIYTFSNKKFTVIRYLYIWTYLGSQLKNHYKIADRAIGCMKLVSIVQAFWLKDIY